MTRLGELRLATWRSARGSQLADLHRIGLRVTDLEVAVGENERLDQRLEAQVAALEGSLVPLLEARARLRPSEGMSS